MTFPNDPNFNGANDPFGATPNNDGAPTFPQQNQQTFQRPNPPQYFPGGPRQHGCGCGGRPREAAASSGIPFWKIFVKDVCLTILGVSLFSVLLFLGIIAVFGAMAAILGTAISGGESETALTEITLRGDETRTNRIVVLPLEGEIVTETDGFVAQAVENLQEDEDLKALVLRVDSPGGTISGSDYYHHILSELKNDRKIPVVVSMGDLTASGGYYVSMVGDTIFAERSTLTGSIGVIIPMYNAAALCEKVGVKSSAVTSGAMKGMGDFMKEPTPEETAIWQGLVNDGYEQFLSVVREGRPYFRGEDGQVDKEKDEELRKIADGRVYSANQALENHLVDKIGFLDDAIDEAIQLAGVAPGSVHVVQFKEEEGLLDALGLGVKSKQEPLNRALDAVSTPRAYYLCPRALPL